LGEKLNVPPLGELTLSELNESEQTLLYAQMLVRVLELRKQQLIKAEQKQNL